ncbi:GNAT family N-acetyltransferase [Isobaculum melis]|uniref:Acetyltransferase (GNAT) family protein n=1 Tax=Isobaculum melis TaxID=142588 RepID=A0A1H9RQM8_9LACT|nr:GNAT family N-acetyltransferase [Isobaculum melis]SER75092.1 Acetyltransferase (GNAT) family protein [Isobaculum melis]
MKIIETRNPALMARLGRMMQEKHRTLYPTFFKPYNQAAVQTYFEEIFANPNEVVYLWQDQQEEVAAYLWLGIETVPETVYRYGYKRLYIHHIAIMPEYQGKGLSKTLLSFADDYAKQHQIDAVELHYWPDNSIAKHTYEKFGYVPYQEIAQKKLHD